MNISLCLKCSEIVLKIVKVNAKTSSWALLKIDSIAHVFLKATVIFLQVFSFCNLSILSYSTNKCLAQKNKYINKKRNNARYCHSLKRCYGNCDFSKQEANFSKIWREGVITQRYFLLELRYNTVYNTE